MEVDHHACHGVGGYDCGTHRRNKGLCQYLADLEDAVFDTVGDADAEYLFDHPEVGTVGKQFFKMYRVLLVVSHIHYDKRAHRTGDQRAHGGAGSAHFEAVDAHGVADNVDYIDDHGHAQRHNRFAHGLIYHGTRVIKGEERERKRHKQHISAGTFHNVGLDAAVDQVQYPLVEEHNDKAEYNRQRGDCVQHLLGALNGVIVVFAPQRLRHDNGTARRHCRNGKEEQVVHRIDQRDARNSRLACRGHHDRVYHTHQYAQQLLSYKGDHDPEQIFFRKKH